MRLLIKFLQIIPIFILKDIYSHLFKVNICIIILVAFITKSAAAQKITLIRDAESEDLIWQITSPLLKAANLSIEDINIYIVNDSSVNAFVMGGQNIFINTGLITKYNDPSILRGVIAHEIGHIAGGHLARGNEAMKDVSNIAILSYLAGIAAAIAGGGDAGYAVIMGSNHVAQRLAVKHTRTQEESADRLALKYLEETNNSPVGLMKLLTYFNSQETQYRGRIDEYALTHPVSRKRINYIKANLGKFNNTTVSSLDERARMKYVVAKLKAFLQDSEMTLRYANSNSIFDRYSRSIAYFKKGEVENSLSEINNLIELQPENGYFYELKGQILFENGLVADSIKSYKTAIDYLPNPDLARISLSASIISLKKEDKDLLDFAIKNLKIAQIEEKNNGQIFQELAKAYLKIEEEGKANLALSELNLLKRDNKKARKYAKLALDSLKKDDKSNRIKAKDILATTEEDMEDKELGNQ